VLAGERGPDGDELGEGPLEDDPSAVVPGARTEVDDPVGVRHHGLVVLDHDHRPARVDDPVEQGELLAAELRGSVSDVVALRQAVAGRRGVYIAALGLIAAVLIVVAAAAPRAQSWLAGTGASAIFVLLGLAAGFVHRVHSGLRTLRTAATEISATLERNRDADPEVRTALGKLREAESRQVVLQAQHDKVVERVGELGRQLAELAPGQRLSRFVEERAESEDYRRHLGVISTVRKDFEHLVELLKDWRDEGGAQGKVQIDRIVLYIDDLDRCSSRQVVEVLQAVHLLLALDLFVVVVGVDPRWLLRALQREYDKLLTGEEGEWQASPQDYLEKIFNIPFTLPKMNTVSFGTLLRSFAGDNGAAPTARDGLPGADATNGAIQEQPEVAPDRGAELPTAPEVDFVAEERSEAAAATAGAAEIPILPLTPPELDLLTALAPLVGTPREAKRLVNLYRIVRSTRDLSAASRFLGDETTAGEYQAVIILLGLLSGHSRLLESLLAAPAKPQLKPALGGGLVHRPRTSSWGVFAAGIEPRTAGKGWENDIVGALPDEEVRLWQDLHRGLAEATKLVTLHNLDAFQSWAPRIARFSFLLSPSLAEPVPAAAENGAGKRSAAPSLS